MTGADYENIDKLNELVKESHAGDYDSMSSLNVLLMDH